MLFMEGWPTIRELGDFALHYAVRGGEGFCETIRKRAPSLLALLHEVIAGLPGAVAARNPLAL